MKKLNLQLPKIESKINIEDHLHKIDLAFKYKNKKEKQMIYIMIFASIFSIIYLLFWDSSFEDFLDKQRKINSLNAKIIQDKVYLTANPNKKIIQLEKFIRDVNDKIVLLKDKNDYIKSKIETISSLIYDEQAWSKYIYSISTNAKKYNIKILNFTNELATDKRAFGHILDLSLSIDGKYKNTLKFINALERSNLVVDIHNFSIYSKDSLYTDLNISVWGIKY